MLWMVVLLAQLLSPAFSSLHTLLLRFTMSEAERSSTSTPPTSPDNHEDGPTKEMQHEEDRMAEIRRKHDEKREKQLAAQREQDLKGGKDAVDSKYKALEYLLSQSKLYSAIMLEQMTKQEEAETAKDERSKKRAEKREVKAEQVAQANQKRATRGSTLVSETSTDEKKLPSRGRTQAAKPKKGGKISDFVKRRMSRRRLAKPRSLTLLQKRLRALT